MNKKKTQSRQDPFVAVEENNVLISFVRSFDRAPRAQSGDPQSHVPVLYGAKLLTKPYQSAATCCCHSAMQL